MSSFVIPASKIYSKNYEFLSNNKISQVQYSYDNVEEKKSIQTFQIDTIEVYTDDKGEKTWNIFPRDREIENITYLDAYVKNPFFPSGSDNFETRIYKIHFKPSIFFDITSVSYIGHNYSTFNNLNDNGNEKEFEFTIIPYSDFSSHINDDDEEWHKHTYCAIVRNKDDSYDVYVNVWVASAYKTTSGDPIYERNNVSIRLNGLNYETNTLTYSEGITTDNNNKNVYNNEKPIINGNINVNGVSVGETNAKAIYGQYKDKKRTIEIEMPLQKLYNENGDLIYDNNLGQIPVDNDTFNVKGFGKLKDYVNLDSILFKVVKIEFSYNGVPKLTIKGKEISV